MDVPVDVGQTLQHSLTGARNTLRVRAVSSGGLASPYREVEFWGLENPSWFPMSGDGVVIPDACGIPMSAWWAFAFPDPAFEAQIPGSKIPASFPYIGGQDLGLRPSQVGLTLTMNGDGQSGVVSLSGTTGFAIADATIDGTITGQGTGSVVPQFGSRVDTASFGLTLAGTVSAEKPVVDIVCDSFTAGACPLKQAEGWAYLGGAVKSFNEVAQLEATVSPAVALDFDFAHDGETLIWTSGTGTGSLTIEGAFVMDLIEGVLTAEARGTGRVEMTFQTPPAPSYLQSTTAQLSSAIALKIDDWTCDFQGNLYVWAYPDASAVTAAASAIEAPVPLAAASIFDVCSRGDQAYLTGADYAVFRATDPQARESLNDGATSIQTLVANVYPEGHPALASGDDLMLVWVHDDPTKPVWQSKELVYSVHEGLGWSAPLTITNDDRQDFAPQVAFDSAGQAVVVWKRHRSAQTESTALDVDYFNGFEIAWSVWDGTTWSPVAGMTDNAVLDHAPLLVRGNDGQLLLVWRQNAGGELLGVADYPDTLISSVWDGAGWQTPETVLTGAVGVLDLAAARLNAGEMALVYSRDTDGDLTTNTDHELYVTQRSGASWSTPEQLTQDAMPDERPTVFYDDDVVGDLRLLWLKGTTLYALFNGLEEAPQTVTIEGAPALIDYSAAQDSSGNVVLLWQGLSDDGIDIFYATYDQDHEVFNLIDQLTADAPFEKFMAPAFASAGGLVVAYNRTALIPTGVELTAASAFGQTDLCVLEHTFGPDLVPSGMLVVPANPVPGSTAQVSVTLHNTGDRAVAGPSLSLYEGDPDAGGGLVGTVTPTLTLVGGGEAVVSLHWPVPSSGGPFTLFAVADPGDLVAELDETNNVLQVVAAAPDVLVDDLRADYGSGQTITLTAQIRNAGAMAADDVAIELRRDDPVVGLLISEQVLASLDAGATTTVVVLWDVAALATGRYDIHVVLDASETITEVNESNNTASISVAVLPDLVLLSEGLLVLPDPEALPVASILIYNGGLRDGDDVLVGIYDRVPDLGVTPVVTDVVDVPAGEHIAVTLPLSPLHQSGFYVGAGWDGALDDRNFGDNLLLYGWLRPERVYLPLVLRR